MWAADLGPSETESCQHTATLLLMSLCRCREGVLSGRFPEGLPCKEPGKGLSVRGLCQVPSSTLWEGLGLEEGHVFVFSRKEAQKCCAHRANPFPHLVSRETAPPLPQS